MPKPEGQPETYSDGLRIAVTRLPKPVRMRAENAISGFDKARALIDIDREMASFRAITAEEEAAAALFKSFQLRAYPGSEKLNLWDHRQKTAVGPFIQAVKVSLAARHVWNLHMSLDLMKPELEIHLPLSELGVQMKGIENPSIRLVHPLGLLSTRGEEDPATFFDDGIKEVFDVPGIDIRKAISKEANLRNKLLYASDSEAPKSKLTAESLAVRRSRAEITLGVCIAILQTTVHQQLAKQALQSFLRCMGRPADEQFRYRDEPSEIEITITDQESPAKITSTAS